MLGRQECWNFCLEKQTKNKQSQYAQYIDWVVKSIEGSWLSKTHIWEILIIIVGYEIVGLLDKMKILKHIQKYVYKV